MNNSTKHRESQHKHASKLAHWLDDRFKFPGTDIRFGIDPIISLVPGAGDWLAGALSSYFIILGARAEVPKSILLRMGFNVLLDILIGSIPILGDIFDIGWKANTRNAELLEKYQNDAELTQKQSKWMLWAVVIIMLLLIIGTLVLLSWLIVEILEAVL